MPTINSVYSIGEEAWIVASILNEEIVLFNYSNMRMVLDLDSFLSVATKIP